MQGCIVVKPGRSWVASIDFGKTIGHNFKIWPVEIKFCQELHVAILDLLYCYLVIELKDFLQKKWNIFFSLIYSHNIFV